MTNPVDDCARAVTVVGDLICEIRPDQWTAPTPCTEWTVRDMVNHLVEGNLVFTALLEGVPPPERGLDRLGGDPVAAYRASAAALQAAVARPGVLQRSYPGPLGVGSGAEKLQIRVADLLTHGWDLRQATGIAAEMPDDLVEQGLALLQERLATQPRIGRFAAPQPVGDNTAAIERLAAFLGRRVPPERSDCAD